MLTLAGLFGVYGWLYHGWLTAVPPSSQAEFHRAMSVRYLVMAAASLGATIVSAWWLLRRR